MKRKSGRPRGRPVTGHIKVQFNLRPEVSELVRAAAAKRGVTRSRYVAELILAAAQRDG